ncbi:MAG: asparagine synthase-related protein [Candidatus Thermoplasmatota archaeon]|nr:asparagine synthase-related protein [Candidatus Thermoplasmatota archaeon]
MITERLCRLESELEQSLKGRSGSALAFSGGLDSSIILVSSGLNLKPYTAGFDDSRDVAVASETALLLGSKTSVLRLDRDYVRKIAEIIIKLDPQVTRKEIGYEIVLGSILDRSEEDAVVTGQGADELFYGYHVFLDQVVPDNSKHLEKLYSTTLPREMKMAEEFSKELVTPFLSDGVKTIAESLGGPGCIGGSRNKIPLRDLAKKIGIPETVAERPKKAAQYGSGVQNELRKIRLSIDDRG